MYSQFMMHGQKNIKLKFQADNKNYYVQWNNFN